MRRQRNMSQVKEQNKTPEKGLNKIEISNLSDGKFKTLVIRMLTEMVEYDCKIEEKVKAMQSEIQENVQEPTVKGRKPGLKSMIWSKSKK